MQSFVVWPESASWIIADLCSVLGPSTRQLADDYAPHTDSQSIAAWSYDSSSKMLISFDTPQVSKAKAQYVSIKGIGGGMWWEGNGDFAVTDARSLIAAFTSLITQRETTQNVLSYPYSKWDNLRAGMP
jgi:chitinase